MGEEVTNGDIQELSLLLENRTFVDYFNVFLGLPVFGQHVFYNYMEAEFEFEPPIKQRRHLYLDRREILKWLFEHRLRLFKQSPLYTEYSLSNKLRTVETKLPGLKDSDEDGEDRNTFTRNVMGTAMGMMLFRESMRGTCGENVYRCWKDIEAWRLMENPVRKMFWKNAIRTKYISQSSATEVKGKIKFLVYRGILNFDLTPEDAVQQKIIDSLLDKSCVESVESDDALLQLQTVLLGAMTSYWVPRHLIHVAHSTPSEALSILRRPAPGDMEYLSRERKLRCRFMFPTIYRDSNVISPITPVFLSESAGDLPSDLPSDDQTEEVEQEIAQLGPMDLLALCGGPIKDIDTKSSSPVSDYSSSFPSDDSPDELSRIRFQSSASNRTRHVKSPIPMILTSYLGGKKRTLFGRFPKIANRVVWSLASDLLACCPFRTFLEKKELIFDLHYLNFWTDVRNYLDTDESAIDCFGKPLRRILAHKLMQSYLSKSGECCDIFSETLKMSLFHAIADNNDVALLCMAQDIVQESLWGPLKLYIEDERKGFLKQVRDKRYNMKAKRQHPLECKHSKSDTSLDNDRADSICFFNCAVIQTESPDSGSPPPTIPGTSALSRPATSYHISITEEQMWKAMEITVLCCEYGTNMMIPQTPPKPQDLVDVLHGDYGSLHVSRVPAVKQDWLRSQISKQKVNIETVRVSRKVYLEPVDISLIKKDEKDKEDDIRHTRNRLVIRRNGLVLDRPTKPRSFIEVLTTSIHFDYFKRFMLVQKAGLPVFFWKAVEDLKDLSNAKTRQIRVTQIVRKFFGKFAKYGASLDCHEEIVRQIPNMEKVTPSILICAQAAIFRSMERKWYPLYLETYPPESEISSSSPPSTILVSTIAPPSDTPELAEVVNYTRKAKKKSYGNRKTLQLWRTLTRALAQFCKAIDNKAEIQLLDIFLKCEVEKEQAPKDPVTHQLDKNIMMSNMTTNVQTRVVIRNRLIILNRLPKDLKFWMEVKKYQEIVDSAYMKGDISTQDTELLCDKARSVIACYLQSDVPPKVQVNIPNDMAFNIINGLASGGPTRGLFHDAVILLFPLLYHFWRKFQDEWMDGDIPDDYIETIERAFRDNVAITPHADEPTHSYNVISDSDFKIVTQPMTDDNGMKIHFSISEGVSFVYPQPKLQKSGTTVGGRRMTRHSIHTLTEEPLSQKESRTTTVRRPSAAGKGVVDEHMHKVTPQKEKKKTEKITVKELEKRTAPAVNDLAGERSSMEKARRLSMLVESLNKERDEKIKEQNKKYSKIMSFEAVVAAAMQELSDTNSVFS